jgi:undecaprenyl-diphosphatase
VRVARTLVPRTAAAAVAVACLLVLVVLGLAVAGGSAPWAVDRWASAEVTALHPDRDMLLAIDMIGEPVGAVLAVGLLGVACLFAGRRRLAVAAPVALAVTGIAVGTLKPLIGRTIHGPQNLAFPSGHTATAAVLAVVLLLLVVDLTRPGRRTAAVLVVAGTVAAAGAMAVAQVALSAHYATDTVGGLCLAVVVVTGTARIARDPRAAAPAPPRPRSTRG